MLGCTQQTKSMALGFVSEQPCDLEKKSCIVIDSVAIRVQETVDLSGSNRMLDRFPYSG
jgi:hypothetical protein